MFTSTVKCYEQSEPKLIAENKNHILYNAKHVNAENKNRILYNAEHVNKLKKAQHGTLRTRKK